MVTAFSPRIFISYSRRDSEPAAALAADLRRQGFQIYLDVAENDPGENFVVRISNELRKANAVIALITEHYPSSRWAQAELYNAVTLRKLVIPLVIPPASVASLDPPLERLLRDAHFVTYSGQGADPGARVLLGPWLRRARRRRHLQLAARLLGILLPVLALALAAGWAVANLNAAEVQERRDEVLQEVTQTAGALQKTRVAALAERVPGDRRLMGELLLIAGDPAQTSVARFNSMALAGEMLQGQQEWRWYIRDLDLNGVEVKNSSLLDASFLKGSWEDVRFSDMTFSGVHWAAHPAFGISKGTFERVQFHGGVMNAISAVNVSFLNSKFRGATVDTTNFGKVRFATVRPPEKGNATITAEYALFENSTLISNRIPPEPHILDLSEPEDDVVFEDVVFVDCRLQGWFKPAWFRNCSFERCAFPVSLSRDELERNGNKFVE
ncbi:MAG TPA: toll/interleukin-1 receptor domain-containing protein [Thermoanaerobaculia bacterium]|nr:toll/interleukin-1 receptor domain-containing protein [Thermoanaerobaculia bacterium]